MRVALVCGRYLPSRDGVADYVRRLRQALAADGVEVLVAAARGSEGADAEVCPDWSLRSAVAAARGIAALAPDVVHVQFAPSAYSYRPGVGLLPALLRAPVVTTLHEYAWWAWPSRRIPDLSWRPLERAGWWDRETLLLGPHSRALLATNSSHARAVSARLRREPRLVPIGPNVPDVGLSPAAAHARVAELWGVPPEAALLAFFGFVHPVKGVRYLLEALARLRDERREDLRLVVAGGFESLALPGQEALDFRAELERHAAERGVRDAVVFAGHVPDADVSALLRACDALVLPLTAGVTPKSGALLAGLDHACCVVATLPPSDGSGPLRDGVQVVAIERVRDSDAVAAALRQVLNDPELRDRVRAGGRAFAADYRWPAIAKAHREVYEQVLAGQVPARTGSLAR